MRTALVLLLAGCAACLPADNRPEPGTLQLEVARSTDAADGFVTDDGWTITFDRFVTALGATGVRSWRDDRCVDYSQTRYDRLFDFAVADTSPLALQRGLGRCTMRYRMGSPSDVALLEDGVTEADREAMIDPRFGQLLLGEDDDVERGIGLIAIGTATKDGVTKRFNWRVQQQVAIRRCYRPGFDPDDEDAIFKVDLEAGAPVTVRAEVRARELFRRTPARDAPILFQPYADADRNDDGVVQLEELSAVSLEDIEKGLVSQVLADVEDELDDEIPRAEFAAVFILSENLRFYLEWFLFPRVAAFEAAAECQFVAEGPFDDLD